MYTALSLSYISEPLSSPRDLTFLNSINSRFVSGGNKNLLRDSAKGLGEAVPKKKGKTAVWFFLGDAETSGGQGGRSPPLSRARPQPGEGQCRIGNLNPKKSQIKMLGI